MTDSQTPTKNNDPKRPQAWQQAAVAAIGQIKKHLAFQRELGIELYPLNAEVDKFINTSKDLEPCPGPKQVGQPEQLAAQPAQTPVIPQTSLPDLAEELNDCSRCNLGAMRKNLVFGEGSLTAQLIIIGQWPGEAENLRGLPFQGEAGELLNKMLAAIGLKREQVYLTNLTKCFSATTPGAEAMEACLPFLLRQIEAIQPKLICAMGTVAAQRLLHSTKPLSQLRGTFHTFRNIPLMPTFHPDFLIKNPEMKRAAWVDLQMIQKELNS